MRFHVPFSFPFALLAPEEGAENPNGKLIDKMLQDVEKTTKIIVPPFRPLSLSLPPPPSPFFLFPLFPPLSLSYPCFSCSHRSLSSFLFFTYFPSLNFIISPILPSLHHSTSPHRFYIFLIGKIKFLIYLNYKPGPFLFHVQCFSWLQSTV